MSKLKAYIVTDVTNDDGGSDVVFAETANKAKLLSYNTIDGIWADEYINMRAKRVPSIDKYANIRTKSNRLDWDIPEHRKILEEELGCYEV